jgi:type IV secretory pathway ATPase VirB11/archaellum biosynthesis ATPase
MLMDIVKNIVVSQDDFDLAGEIIGLEGLLQAAADAQADSIVLGAVAATEVKDLYDLLYSRPRIKIIIIAADGREAILHELQPHVIPLGEVAPASLIAAIRGTPEPNGTPSTTNND